MLPIDALHLKKIFFKDYHLSPKKMIVLKKVWRKTPFFMMH